MSLAVYIKSASRGECFQNCRRKYRVVDDETGEEMVVDNQYVMSPKDICTIEFLDRILDSGVAILKLEGRGRSADYVYTVAKAYKEAAVAWAAGAYTLEKIDHWDSKLETVFNRVFWKGSYYLGEKLGEWCGFGGSRAKKQKIHLGKVNKYFGRIGIAELSVDACEVRLDNQLLITGDTAGAVKFFAEEIRIDEQPAEYAPRGSIISIPVPEKLRKNDVLYLVGGEKNW